MPESSIVVRPERPGSASYTESSRLQAAGLPAAIGLFEQASNDVPLPEAPQPIVIADYGAGTGHNSLLPIAAAITRLRTRTRRDQSILVAHTDAAENDFTVLFRTLADDPASYLKHDSATYASAVGRSFYQQILPSNSVTLGWSSWAVQWLSRAPTPITDHVQADCSADPGVRAAYARQAAEDWHEFVAFRGRELSPHGRLVVLTMAIAESGEPGLRPVFDHVLAVLRELIGEGLLTEDELGAMALPIVGRSAMDFVAPFSPKGTFEHLTVEHLEVFNAEDRYWSQYQIDKDAKAFGARWAAFARAAAFPTLAGALVGGVGDPRRAEFLDRLEEGLVQRLAAAPEQMRIPLAKVVLVKAGRSH
ncbi:class I SAM-dependent methyltransferase [Mycolicibacterium komossense]|uniref:SAM-dependent methyltransferase n=1 Tax=Mycolicibacterium komossense TaxID=1779 RepID=A0ABT3C652_9MYCO|nr:class I SAM-dependent methyltransferase [Mycolicibacterium komossense]MCV7224943.1 SAM-dependent methyltransferase [Mycolicibacterium komossense]